ncbi:hypothetical protein KRX54_03835 [Actinomycetaceae bacterium TAE3-ERU4]|nr:hypothetical protein [Actinomycetaceae bacterium TAE3-ERU4]
MPEGHSIHRTAYALNDLFASTKVACSSPQGRFESGASLLSGLYLTRALAWGKHLFVPFSASPEGEYDLADLSGEQALSARWLHIHLGLYGSWNFYTDGSETVSEFIGAPRRKIGEGDEVVSSVSTQISQESWQHPQPRGQVRLRISTPQAVADLSGPNTCEVLEAQEVISILARLGPDPLAPQKADAKRFSDLVRRRGVPVGQLVMDQSVVAGPGNIYRAECLFRVGINPNRPGKQVSQKRLELLWKDLVSAMSDGVREGKIITVPKELVPEALSEFDQEAARFAVYHRTGRPCLRCGSEIKESNLAGRKLFWCPGCQR